AVGELTLARLENDPTKIALAVGKVTAGVTALVSDIDGLPGALESQLPKTYRDATGIATRLGPRMVDLLLIDAIRESSGGAYALLFVLGLIEETPQDEAPAEHRPPFEL